MVRINWLTRILLFLSILLGTLGGIFDLYHLMLLSIIIIFLSLSFSTAARNHQMVFLFPLVFLTSLSFNTRLSLVLSSLNYEATLHSFLLFLIIFFALISVEELILCVLGLILWGDQVLVHYKHPFYMMQSSQRYDYSVRGYFPNSSDIRGQHYIHKL